MKRQLARFVIILTVFCGAPWANAQDKMSNQDLVDLTKAGLGESIIVAKIVNSATRTNFDTSVDALVMLSAAGVDDRVLAAMVNPQRAVSDLPPSIALPPRNGDGWFPLLVALVGVFGVVSVPAITAFLATRRELAAGRRAELAHGYQAFLDYQYGIQIHGSPDKELIARFLRAMAIGGSDAAIRSWLNSRSMYVQDTPPDQIFETVLQGLRRDLGHADKKLNKGDLAQLLLLP